MTDTHHLPDPLIRKLLNRSSLDDGDIAAISALPFRKRTVPASTYLLREGQLPLRCGFIVEGYAFRQKLSADGNRSIVCVMVPGDLFDVQNLLLGQSDHDVQALTRLTVAEVAIGAFRDMTMSRPGLINAMWTDGLAEAAIYREWLLNVGRRPAPARLAHLLCEFQVRLRAAGMGSDDGYELPMTQEQLGDTLGLTSVHVNRVLKTLERQGLISRKGRQLTVLDWNSLQSAAQFNPRYLHLDRLQP